MPVKREKDLSLQEAFHPVAPAVLQLVVQTVQVAVPADKVFIITYVSNPQAEKVKKEHDDQEDGEGNLPFS